MHIAYFLTHPIQYQSPLLRHFCLGGVDLHVVYGNDSTTRAHHDSGFGQEVAWDIPLMGGYASTVLNANEPPGSGCSRKSHFQRQVAAFLDREKFDVVWVHGWAHPLMRAAWSEARQRGIPLMLRGETFLGCVRGGWMPHLLHRLVFSRKFRQVSAFLAVGTLNAQLYRAYGVPEDRIFLVPYVVDNDFFQQRCREALPDRGRLRADLGIARGTPVILFCAKLIAVKDPATLIRAVGKWSDGPVILLMVGDGELRPSMEALAEEIAPGRVKFLGFRNQTELPALYDLCDLFVLPSAFEPWGLVVNEVMNAGKPVIVSDQVGCRPDLVRPGVNGDVFRSGDVDDLHSKMRPWLNDDALRVRGGLASLEIIRGWGFDEALAGLKTAIRAFQPS